MGFIQEGYVYGSGWILDVPFFFFGNIISSDIASVYLML